MRNTKSEGDGFDLSRYRLASGKLAACTSLGCYPLFYVARCNDVLCASCADAEESEGIVAADANWEDPSFFCDGCGGRIESAYAEKEAG